MNGKKLTGLAAIIIGAVLLFFSHYIAERVAAGKLQIQSGQEQVDSVNSLFSGSSYTKPIGKQLTKSGQQQIDAGRAEITGYESLAKKLQIGGAILIVLGVVLFFLGHKKRKH